MPRVRLMMAVLALTLACAPLCAQQKEGKTAKEKTEATDKKPPRKERMRQKKEKIKQKAAAMKEKARVKTRELKRKARETSKELKEKAQVKAEELKEKGMEAKVKADSILDERNAKVTTDTLWVARPKATWIFRGKMDAVGELFHIRAVDPAGQRTDYYLDNEPKVTLGVMANYRGVSLSLSFSPTKILSDISDMVSAINYYSNTFGLDVTYANIGNFRGRTSLQSHRHKLSNTNLHRFNASGYYVFNGKRFSYPAVFNSTWEQKRSAGSFLVQGSFDTGRLKMGDDIDPENAYSSELNKITFNSFALGAGYGYNLVVGEHWLFHLTAQPSMMVWKNYKLHLTEQGKSEVNKMPSGVNVFVVGRVGAIYSWDKYFVGLTGVVQTSKVGKDSDFSLQDTNWQGRAFFGLKL